MPNMHLNYWRNHIPKALYSNLYGPAEITVDCTYYIVDREFSDNELLPIGIPCLNSDVLLLDERTHRKKLLDIIPKYMLLVIYVSVVVFRITDNGKIDRKAMMRDYLLKLKRSSYGKNI